ncbi:MAG TPA: hypothetical protein VF729_02220 [Solirubrobacterales bacterium]
MELARVGPLTTLIEGGAAAVGAGILLGGFATGLVGLVLAWPRRKFEWQVLKGGYAGGAAGALLMIADITFRYAV